MKQSLLILSLLVAISYNSISQTSDEPSPKGIKVEAGLSIGTSLSFGDVKDYNALPPLNKADENFRRGEQFFIQSPNLFKAIGLRATFQEGGLKGRRLNENEEGVSLYGEQKKFTLKTPKPAVEAPAPVAEVPAAPPAVPSPELPPSPMEDEGMGVDSLDVDAEMGPEGEDIDINADMDMESPEGEDEKVTFKTIQKLTGKLTQKIRTLDNEEGMTSENIKYVINMVLSSLDLKSLSEEDKDDIMTKFDEAEEREEGGDMSGDDMGGEDFTDDTEVEDIQADMDMPIESEMYEEDGEEDYGNGAILDHIFGESKIDKVISKYFEITKKEIMESREKVAKKKVAKISEVRKQMGAVVKLTETIEQELASQKFLTQNTSAKIVGKTNKKNLVFENKGKQVRITPEGQIL